MSNHVLQMPRRPKARAVATAFFTDILVTEIGARLLRLAGSPPTAPWVIRVLSLQAFNAPWQVTWAAWYGVSMYLILVHTHMGQSIGMRWQGLAIRRWNNRRLRRRQALLRSLALGGSVLIYGSLGLAGPALLLLTFGTTWLLMLPDPAGLMSGTKSTRR